MGEFSLTQGASTTRGQLWGIGVFQVQVVEGFIEAVDSTVHHFNMA